MHTHTCAHDCAGVYTQYTNYLEETFENLNIACELNNMIE